MPQPFIIRQMARGDIGRAAALYGEALEPSYISFSELGEGKAEAPGVLTGSAVEIFRDQLVSLIDSPRHGFFVAEAEGGGLAGFALASLHEASAGHEECWLDDICVGRAWRRRGAARALAERVFAWGEGRRAKYFLLESGVENESAHHLFHELGFRPLATVFWREGRE